MAKKTTKKAVRKTTARKSTRTAAKSASKAAKSTKRTRKAAKRELIDTGTDKRYVRRGASGQFKESDDVNRSLSSDRRTKAKRKVKSGQGDRGDQ